MASEQIKQSDVAVDDVYGAITSSSKKLEKQTEESNKELEKQADLIKELNEQSEKLSQKGLDKLLESRKEMDKIQKKAQDNDKIAIKNAKALEKARLDQIKLEKAREKAVDDFNKKEERRIKQSEKARLEELRLQKAREKAFDKEEKAAKRREEENRASVRLRRELKELKKQYFDVAAAQGVESKEAIKLKKSLVDLESQVNKIDDSLKDNKDSTEEAEDAIKSLGESLEDVSKNTEAAEGRLKKLEKTAKSLGVIAFILSVLSAIGDQFRNTREGALEFDKVINRITATVKVFVATVLTVMPSIFQVIKAGFSVASAPIRVFISLLKAAKLAVSGDFKEAAEELESTIDNLKEPFVGLDDAVKNIAGSFDGFTDRVKATIDETDILIDKTLKYTIQIEELERQLTKATEAQELANAAADDATLSFEERIKASEEVLKQNIKVADAEAKIASKRLELAEQQIKSELANTDIKVKSTQEIIDLLKDEEKALKVSDESSRAFTDAFIARQEAETQAEVARFDQSKQRRELEQDLRERDLDIELDNFDNIKTINERRIANDKINLEERRRLQEETVALNDKTFAAQIETLQLFTDKQIDGAKLVAENDSTILNEKIRELGLSEILEGRLLEVIRDRRSANNDLAESNEDLVDSEREANEIRKDIADQEVALRSTTLDKLDKLEEDRAENQIEILEDLLENTKEGSIEQLKLRQQLNDALLDEEKKRLEEEKELLEKRQEFIKNITEKGLEELISVSKQRQELLNQEIAASEALEQQLRSAANTQNAIATESLAAQESITEEKLQQREAEAKKEQALEEAKLIYNAINSFLDQGDTLPIASTKAFAGVTGIRKLVEAIPGFFKGTEGRLGDEDKAIRSGKDGHLIWADKDEYIVNGGLVDKAESAGITGTKDLVNKAIMYQQMSGSDSISSVQAPSVTTMINMKPVVDEIQNMTRVLRDKPEVKFDPIIIDGIVKGVEYSVKQGSITNRYKYLINGKA